MVIAGKIHTVQGVQHNCFKWSIFSDFFCEKNFFFALLLPYATKRELHGDHMSPVTRKPAFCICENKDAEELRGNREANQCLCCFRYIASTNVQFLFFLNTKLHASSHLL